MASVDMDLTQDCKEVSRISTGHAHQYFKDLEGSPRYPLGREGVYAPVGPAFLAHTKQKVSNIVDLTVLRLAFFMGYE